MRPAVAVLALVAVACAACPPPRSQGTCDDRARNGWIDLGICIEACAVSGDDDVTAELDAAGECWCADGAELKTHVTPSHRKVHR